MWRRKFGTAATAATGLGGRREKGKRYHLSNEGKHSLEIKKSKFVSFARRIISYEDARQYLLEVQDSKATHNCWGCRIKSVEYCSDDGEPSGTAGSPILTAIRSFGVEDVMIVVTRYYGGIKLGTGGLSRAYGSAAFGCLESAQKIEYFAETSFSVTVAMSKGNVIYEAVRIHGGEILKIHQEDKDWLFVIKSPLESSQALIDWIRNETKGDCKVKTAEGKGGEAEPD
jgi:uncharacterized YigZ family protein